MYENENLFPIKKPSTFILPNKIKIKSETTAYPKDSFQNISIRIFDSLILFIYSIIIKVANILMEITMPVSDDASVSSGLPPKLKLSK